MEGKAYPSKPGAAAAAAAAAVSAAPATASANRREGAASAASGAGTAAVWMGRAVAAWTAITAAGWASRAVAPQGRRAARLCRRLPVTGVAAGTVVHLLLLSLLLQAGPRLVVVLMSHTRSTTVSAAWGTGGASSAAGGALSAAAPATGSEVIAGDAPVKDAARGALDCPAADRVSEINATVDARMLRVASLLRILAAVVECDYSKLDGSGPWTAATAMQKVGANSACRSYRPRLIVQQ
jgi:hypothetical protein